MANDLWCQCGGPLYFDMEHTRLSSEHLGPAVKPCMCRKWLPCTVRDSRRFKPGTDSNFYKLLEDGRVVRTEPFAPHVFNPKRRKAG